MCKCALEKIVLNAKMNRSDIPNSSNIRNESNFEAIRHKRRSSVFQSRVLTFQQDIEKKEQKLNESVNEILKPAEYICDNVDQTFSIHKYIDNVKQERCAWHQMLKERRNQKRILSKQISNTKISAQEFDLTVLSNLNRFFLSAYPDYNKMCKDFKKLLQAAVKMIVLNQLNRKLKSRFSIKIQKKLHDFKKITIEMSKSKEQL